MDLERDRREPPHTCRAKLDFLKSWMSILALPSALLDVPGGPAAEVRNNRRDVCEAQ